MQSRVTGRIEHQLGPTVLRKALKLAAADAGCEFPFFRRANITIRQEEGGSAIEAAESRITQRLARPATTRWFRKRQEELTRALQGRRRPRMGRILIRKNRNWRSCMNVIK